jgi:hypothetical protein
MDHRRKYGDCSLLVHRGALDFWEGGLARGEVCHDPVTSRGIYKVSLTWHFTHF